MRILIGALAAMPILVACAATPDYQPIVTKDEYMTQVVGRTVNFGSGSSTTHPDGTMTGSSQDGEVKGTWSWEDGKFCREGTVGTNVMERDCQALEIAGNKLRVSRGNGTKSEFDLE